MSQEKDLRLVGERVSHKLYGEGTIVTIMGNEKIGFGMTCLVLFDSGRKERVPVSNLKMLLRERGIRFEKGEKVVHKILGKGVLVSDPDPGWDSEAMVRFDALPKNLENPYKVICGDLTLRLEGLK